MIMFYVTRPRQRARPAFLTVPGGQLQGRFEISGVLAVSATGGECTRVYSATASSFEVVSY